MFKSLIRPLFLAGLTTLLAACATSQTPSTARAGAVVDMHHGIAVPDPYRALEDLKNPQTQAWVDAQAEQTRAVLERLPGRKLLAERVAALDALVTERVYNVQRLTDGRVFYIKLRPGDGAARIYLRQGYAGVETLVFDPQTVGAGMAINNYAVAPDGRKLAVVVAQDDAELGQMLVIDTATRQPVTTPIDHIWGELSATWHPDSQRFYYPRSSTTALGTAPPEPFAKVRIYERTLGTGPAQDRAVWGWDVAGAPPSRPNDWTNLAPVPGSSWMLGRMAEGVNGNVRLYAAPLAQLGRPDTAWTPVVRETDRVRGYSAVGNFLYLRTASEASRFRVLRLDLRNPQAAPVQVVAQQTGVIDSVDAAADGLYVVVREGATSRLFVQPLDGDFAQAHEVVLPHQGAVEVVDAEPDQSGVLLTLAAWTKPSMLLAVNATAIQAINTGLRTPPTIDTSQLQALDLRCTSHDGVQVPMSLLSRKGIALDGNNPTILQGYGGYGEAETAWFNLQGVAWLERGGILAIVDPRGGGAYGEDWYQAGVGATKPNTWKDMIACAQTLIKAGYTRVERLAVHGVSMGGVAAGRALTARPDLFGVGLLQVGILDAVRFIEATDNGPNHALEMGSLADAAQVRQLLAMSTYANIQDGTRYPAILLLTGLNDNRVAPWQSFKAAARFQAATTSGKPVLLRVNRDGGHGITAAPEARNAQWLDIMSFTLWQMGDPAFQP
jgi:prolyl oligopeptidase